MREPHDQSWAADVGATTRAPGPSLAKHRSWVNATSSRCAGDSRPRRLALRAPRGARCRRVPVGSDAAEVSGGVLLVRPGWQSLVLRQFRRVRTDLVLSLIHISEPTRLGMISYAV